MYTTTTHPVCARHNLDRAARLIGARRASYVTAEVYPPNEPTDSHPACDCCENATWKREAGDRAPAFLIVQAHGRVFAVCDRCLGKRAWPGWRGW